MSVTVVVALLAGSLPSATAQAQTSELSAVQSVLRQGERIEVIRTDGAVVTGKLHSLLDDRLVLMEVPIDQRQVLAGDIVRISRWERDPISNGAVLGALIGIGAGVIIGQVAANTDEPVAGMAFGFGLLGGLGVGIAGDALTQRKVAVFPAVPARASLAPILTGHQKGVKLTLVF